MKKILSVVLGVLMFSAPAFAQATAKSAPEKTLNATGEVSAVSPTSLTVKGKSGEWTFAVDKETRVAVQGASKKTAAAKDAKEALEITKYVKVGDTVMVKYHEQGATKHAADVQVRSSNPIPVKK